MPETKVIDVEILGPEVRDEFTLKEATSAGELAVHRQRGQVAEAPKQSPGRTLTAAEAAQRMAAVNFDGDTMARIGEMMAGIQGEDEISNEQALAHLARRRGQERNHVPADVPTEPEPVVPNTLPAVISQAMVFKDPNWKPQIPLVEPQWMTVYDTPNYMQEQVRGLGRTIFRSFPCFARHQDEAGADDPLGIIRLVANYENRGPNSAAEVQAAARYIRDNGMGVDMATLELPDAIPGYQPRVVLAVSDDISMLLVEESREFGAPVNGQAIYAWRGGRAFYLANPQAADRLANHQGDPNAPRRIGAPARALPAPGGRMGPQRLPAQRVARPARLAPPPAEPVEMPEFKEVRKASAAERKERLAKIPVAAAATTAEVVTELRKQGFMPGGSPLGPVLNKKLDDGVVATVFGEKGKSLAASSVWYVKLYDADGDVLQVSEITRAFQIEEALTPPPSGPRP